MAKQLLSASLTAPGFKGLNTEDPYTLDPEFAVQAENFVIDQRGRLVSRKGWKARGNDPKPLSGVTVYEDVVGQRSILSWYNNGTNTLFYKGINLEPIPYFDLNEGSSPDPADWTSVTLNDFQYFYAKGKRPLRYDGNDLKPIEERELPVIPVPKAGIALAAYGRVWVADTPENSNVLYFSSLLDGQDFGDVDVSAADGTGRNAPATNENPISTAGLFNISALFTDGTDRITGLGAINGYLAIFCEDSIVLLGDNNPNNDSLTLNPATMTVIEIIKGVGCVSAKSIQNIGNDILFLSKSGVQSLGRTIQEKSQPLVSISQNVKTDLTIDLAAEADLSKITSVYSEENTFYLLQLPSSDRTYVFDTRSYLETGALRVTRWSSANGAEFVVSPETEELGSKPKLFRTTDQGLAEYTGFTDLDATIPLVFHSPYLDYGLPNSFKFIKKVGATFTGGDRQELRLTAAGDFNDVDLQPSAILAVDLGNVSRFDTPQAFFAPDGSGAKFGVGTASKREVVPYGGTAELIQLRCVASTSKGPLAIQRFDLYFKEGKQL